MGKARFYDRLLFILIFTTAFLVSGNVSTETVDEIKEQIGKSIHKTNKYNSMKIHYVNYPDDGADFLWKNMERNGNATKLSDEQFVDGKALIDLPFGFQLFDLNVTRVAVTKQGTIQTADPSVNWTIAPLNAKFGLTRSKISFLSHEKNFYVQWNNFRFNHEIFQEHEFRFQVRLGERGEIVFVYKEVPFDLAAWREYCDCLGDKFGVMYTHQELFKVPPYKENYELGFSMDFEKYEVKQGTVVRFFPADCPSKSVRCSWCPAIEKCSSTRDSLRHVWKENKCEIHFVHDPDFCPFDVLGPEWFPFLLLVWIFTNLAIAAIVCITTMTKKIRKIKKSSQQEIGYPMMSL
ncbi:Hypothetical predicted protein [Cloeon dipterum]|uniref:Uncharacterized protein n=1 Tax=Cloeon dipterum TaxID=197152 RepID=A0A8S1DJ85_9INSE|nr:Hypothetical predicted protein [Cloeon dipterum]